MKKRKFHPQRHLHIVAPPKAPEPLDSSDYSTINDYLKQVGVEPELLKSALGQAAIPLNAYCKTHGLEVIKKRRSEYSPPTGYYPPQALKAICTDGFLANAKIKYAKKLEKKARADASWAERQRLEWAQYERDVARNAYPQHMQRDEIGVNTKLAAFVEMVAREFPEVEMKFEKVAICSFMGSWRTMERSEEELVPFLRRSFDDWFIVSEGYNQWCEQSGKALSRFMKPTPNWPDLAYKLICFLQHYNFQVGLRKDWGQRRDE